MKSEWVWKIFWSIVGILILATIFLTWSTYNTYREGTINSAYIEAAKIFFLCLGGSGVITSTFFTAANMFLQRQANIIENTFNLLLRWDDKHYLDARKLTRQLRDNKENISDNDLIKMINEKEDLKQSVILVMNYLEHIRFSLKTNRIDKQIFYNSLGITIIDIAERFKPYAKSVNTQTSTDLEELIMILKQFPK